MIASLVALPVAAAADDCPGVGGLYEGFRVTGVSVETPLQFPVGWIQNVLVGPAINSLRPVAESLPVREGMTFHLTDHVQTISLLGQTYTELRPGERFKLAVGVPWFPSCNFASRTVSVAYRIYSTDAAYFVSRLLEVPQDVPTRSLTVGKAAETKGKLLPVPFFGYTNARGPFGGIGSSWANSGRFFNSLRTQVGASSSSYLASLSAGGIHDPGQGAFSHIEWNIGGRASKDPAQDLRLKESIGTVDFFAATRARGPFATLVRFGGTVEAGNVESEAIGPNLVTSAPKRSIKTYVGGSWTHDRERWNVTSGVEFAKGTAETPVDFHKYLIDAGYEIRLLPREHWPIQLDAHANGGWISGTSTMVPVADRFFGGNLTTDFINNPLWKLPAGPLIRSVSQNALTASGPNPALGGTRFSAINFTAAVPAWGIPAIPAIVRNAKPLADGMNFGLRQAESASVEDYLARTPQFPAALKRAEAVIPDLKSLRDRLGSIATQDLPANVRDEINDLVNRVIKEALESIQLPKDAQRRGIAWNACRKLAGADPDSFPLAYLHDHLLNIVAPGVEAVNRVQDGQALRDFAKRLELDRSEIAALLEPISRSVVLDAESLSRIEPVLAKLRDHAKHLATATDALSSRPDAIGPLASATSEWSAAVANLADLDDEPDQTLVLYNLNQLAIGTADLLPPEIERAISAGFSLARAVDIEDHDAARSIVELTQSLRDDLAQLAPLVQSLKIPAPERWARQQNAFFVRALDVAFREMTMAGVRYVGSFDMASLGASAEGPRVFRYGVGPGIQLTIVSFQLTLGYSFNPNRQPSEPRGAFFLTMEVADLFR